MNHTDYPALFNAAEAASAAAQVSHLRALKSFAALSIVGAGLGAYGIESQIAALAAALLFLGALFVSIYMAVRKFDSTWYRARAVSESIKTSVWRYMMKAEPYDHSELEAKNLFREKLRRILSEHRDLGHDLAGAAGGDDQITATMTQVRRQELPERTKLYCTQRIEEQRDWYDRKAGFNKKAGETWFGILVALQTAAVVCTLLRVVRPEAEYWPTEVFVVGAGAVLSWTQTKRFRELAAAYSVAAHEIRVARSELDDIADDRQFSQFVSNTENAFSREHTQWVARRA